MKNSILSQLWRIKWKVLWKIILLTLLAHLMYSISTSSAFLTRKTICLSVTWREIIKYEQLSTHFLFLLPLKIHQHLPPLCFQCVAYKLPYFLLSYFLHEWKNEILILFFFKKTFQSSCIENEEKNGKVFLAQLHPFSAPCNTYIKEQLVRKMLQLLFGNESKKKLSWSERKLRNFKEKSHIDNALIIRGEWKCYDLISWEFIM